MTKGTLKDARNRIIERGGAIYTVKNPACFARLVANYFWGETPKNTSMFTVRSGDEARTYTRADFEKVVEQAVNDVEFVERGGCTK